MSNTVAIYSKTTTLTAAQIRALDTTAITLVPAPGTGKALLPVGFVQSLSFVTQRYYAEGLVNAQLNLQEGSQLITQYSDSILKAAASAAGFAPIFLPWANANNAGQPVPAITLLANQPLTISCPSTVSYNSGPIVTSAKAVGGANYHVNDVVMIDPNANASTGDATATILTIDGGGAVLTYSISNPGTAYALSPSAATGGAAFDTSGGNGTGFTLNVTSVTAGDGTFKITVNYSIADVS